MLIERSLDSGSVRMTALPPELVSALTAASLDAAADALTAVVDRHGLQWKRTDSGGLPTYQYSVRVGTRAHPVITLQQPPNNPDIPFQKMRGLTGSYFSGKGPRRWQAERLNELVPELDRKDPDMAAEKMFKLRWALLGDPDAGPSLLAEVEAMIGRIRRGG